LGHILNNCNTDKDDIINRRNVLVRQTNDVCYFAKLSPVVKLRLLYSYCSSLYGAELWNLNSPELAAIGVSQRKALKRVWNLPNGTHFHILYAICGKWSIEDEIRRRSLRFIVSCLSSNCSVVRDVVKMCFTSFPATSLLDNNILEVKCQLLVTCCLYLRHCSVEIDRFTLILITNNCRALLFLSALTSIIFWCILSLVGALLFVIYFIFYLVFSLSLYNAFYACIVTIT
jgi:hypothetical protein